MHLKDNSVGRKLAQYSDLIVVAIILLALLGGGIAAIVYWRYPSEEQFDTSMIPMTEVVNIGVGRDGIMPIDAPRFEDVAQAAQWLGDQSPVIVVTLGEPARAYPLRVMIRHEIVNDWIGDEAIAVTYCPICNSPVVYRREVEDEVLRLGVTGNLYRSGFIMWDDQTESWWQQFTGMAVAGEYMGTMLDVIPSQVVGFATFARRFPDGLVLAGDENYPELRYVMNPYVGYDESNMPMWGSGDYDERLQPLERVLAAVVEGVPVAYPYALLSQEVVLNDMVNNTPIVVFWQPGAKSALDAMNEADSRDVGQAALFGRELNGQVLVFIEDEGRILDAQTRSEWNIFGEAIAGRLEGERLPDYAVFPHFWFAWSSAHPSTRLYGE